MSDKKKTHPLVMLLALLVAVPMGGLLAIVLIGIAIAKPSAEAEEAKWAASTAAAHPNAPRAPEFCDGYETAATSALEFFEHVPASLIDVKLTCKGRDSKLTILLDRKVKRAAHATVLADRIARATGGRGNAMVSIRRKAVTSPQGQPLVTVLSTAKYYRAYDRTEDLSDGAK